MVFGGLRVRSSLMRANIDVRRLTDYKYDESFGMIWLFLSFFIRLV